MVWVYEQIYTRAFCYCCLEYFLEHTRSCGNLPFMPLRLNSTCSLAAGAVLLVGREVGPVMAINCSARVPATKEWFESTCRCMQEYFATVALLRLRCLSFELCVFKFASFLVLNISCKKQLWQLAFYASATGFYCFVSYWCCLASGTGSWSRHGYKLLSKSTCL